MKCKWLVTVGAVLSLAGLSQSQASGPAVDPGLMLHFDFETMSSNCMVLDASGNSNHGWQHNSTNLLEAANGVFGTKAAQFRYVGFLSNDFPNVYPFSQYIAVTNLAGFAYLTNATISLWARFDTNNDRGIYLLDNGYRVIYAPGASNSWTLGRLNASYLSFITYPADGTARRVVNWPNDVVRSGGTSQDLSTTNIHLYTVTLDCQANRAVAYYDGKPWMTNTIDLPWLRVYGSAARPWLCVGAMAHLGTPFWGDDRYPNSAYFVGRMDDLRIYNRTLSPSEVQALYLGAGSAAESQNVTVRTIDSESLQLSWIGRSNTWYKVDSRPDVSTGTWAVLGPAILSAGGTNSITNSITGQTKRFYRVYPLP